MDNVMPTPAAFDGGGSSLLPSRRVAGGCETIAAMRRITLRRIAVLGTSVLAAVMIAGATGSSAHPVAHAAEACPVEGQCAINPATGCPLGGPSSGPNTAAPAPIQLAPPKKCVPVPTTLFWVRGSSANGCTEILFVQVQLQPAISQYEAVVYSKIGLGTRWWADPSTPQDQTGPATHAGQTFSYGAASYTVPAGYLAWDVGDYSEGNPAGCNNTAPSPPASFGAAGWGVTGSEGGGVGGRGSGRLKIKGPTRNAFGVRFNQVITGTASGAANEVISGEQLGWTPRCATTLAAEQSRATWKQWPTGTGPVHKKFRLVARFLARNHLKHAICSYLVNRVTKQTYAYAANYWSNS